MKQILSVALLAIALSPLCAHGATPNLPNDSVAVIYADTTKLNVDSIENSLKQVDLNEVTVEASSWVQKADRNLLYPNAQQIEQSRNGLQLLQKLQIPGVIINPTDNSIALADQSEVSLRINGRPADNKEIQALSPEQIVRIEYIDNPGVRYGEVGAVLDFIVKNPTSGGSFMGDITQSVNRGFGEYWLGAKVNSGKSEFSYSGWFSPRWNLKMLRDNTEHYELPDGTRYTRTEESLDRSKFEQRNNGHSLSYNYLDSQKQMFNASLKFYYTQNENLFRGILTDHSPGGTTSLMFDDSKNRSLNPSLNLYYQYNLDEDQLLMANVVASYEQPNSHRIYTEDELLYTDNSFTTGSSLVGIDNLIKSRTYSILGEVDYEKRWKNSRVTVGIRHTQSWTTNNYVAQGIDDRMNLGNSYLFGEYWMRLGSHFDFSAGIGYSLYTYVPRDRESHLYSIWRPRLSARYTIDDYSSLRFNFVRMGSVVSLDMLSPVVQDVDGIQQSTGNPDVKPYATYKYELQYQYNRGIFYGKLGARYTHAPGAIMPEKVWVGDKILTRYNNQKNAEELRFYLDTRITAIPDWLTLSAGPAWHRYWMRGNNYTHVYNNFYCYATFELSHWGFSLEGMLQTNFNQFWGETLDGGENVHTLKLSYNYKDWNFGVMVLDPFINDYKVKKENWNRYAGYHQVITTNMIKQMVAVSVSWNLNWGRRYETDEQRINNVIGGGGVNAAGK
ncbi:TonB-dependent receptor plug domain-containing protein [Barnesiella viscericola]|uniref:Outer membrane beta-barrel family protein n=1 Tax=Barnesiella viscericola TaxID=397865 RepID=A0A921MRP4_9BACT|nr:outer membrane beta-barrel protein [Barnesiella viscericola]HJG88937.1 outer membrane beta-barrel family protein [Barnesiella viscericola]